MAIAHKSWMNVAKEIALNSYAQRNKVGAILVKDGNIIAIGYNGTPSGFENKCEESYVHEISGVQKRTKREVLHAESNAIAKCARSVYSSKDSDLYVTLSPCFECSKMIIQSGIKRVFYEEEYRDLSGLELLKKANVDTIKL